MDTHIKGQFVSIRERCSQIVSKKENGIFFAQQKVFDSTFGMEDQRWQRASAMNLLSF